MFPGPREPFAIGRSITLGRRAGVLSVVGNALGTIPAVVAIRFGLVVILAAPNVAFIVIKIVGATYLPWLGVRAIRRRHTHAPKERPAHKCHHGCCWGKE